MKTNSVLRTSDLHENVNAYKTAAKEYYKCYVVGADGTLTPCLLTEDDVIKGIDRAVKNPEDILPLSLPQKLYHKLLNLLA